MRKYLLKLFREIHNCIPYVYNVFMRKKYDYFQCLKICKPFDVSSFTMSGCNKLYGNDRALKIALQRKFLRYNELIEHGIYFGDNIDSTNINHPIIYTMGRQREIFLRKKGYRAYSIGAYILYSKHFYSVLRLKQIKEELGKTLLVFPSHSIEGINSIYDEESFLREIKKIASEYHTILVCMYWKDFLDGRGRIYESNGYKIVSAGHRSDPSFLPRLKDLIYLSDMTMSNSLGTHVGYSIVMGKPHYMFSQKCFYEGENVEKENHNKNMVVLQERVELFQKTFGVYQHFISVAQLDLVRYYWGDF